MFQKYYFSTFVRIKSTHQVLFLTRLRPIVSQTYTTLYLIIIFLKIFSRYWKYYFSNIQKYSPYRASYKLNVVITKYRPIFHSIGYFTPFNYIILNTRDIVI